jgi:putative Holliday junction resolvase
MECKSALILPRGFERLRAARYDGASTGCYSRAVRVIGIDFGERRIGVAVSDPSGTLARPLKTIERGASDADAIETLHATIAQLASEDEVGSVVVGLPAHLDGTPSPQTGRVSTMVAQLAARLDVPVFTQDERLSSREAEQRLSVREKDWRKRKAKLDAAAAAVILQDYLDAHALSAKRGDRNGKGTPEEAE